MAEEVFPSTVFQQLGEYLLFEEIGESALFRVFKARHARLQRDVIVKFLREGNGQNREALARFRREMEAVGKLQHENIVWVTDAGEHQGTPYLVMEYVPGRTLRDLVAANGALPIADACELARQAAAGLSFIHQRKAVHRDVKPSNLLLAETGKVKLLDFGLVRFIDHETPGDELTAAAIGLGTPDYISPEQARDSRQVDARSDIYSLGCTLFELLAGVPPFSGSNYDTAVKKVLAHTRQPPPELAAIRADLPPTLSRLVSRMLSKSPSDRPATADEVIGVLTPLAKGHRLLELLKAEVSRFDRSAIAETQIAGSVPLKETLREVNRPDRRKKRVTRRIVSGAFLLVIGMGGVIGILFWKNGNPREQIEKQVATEEMAVRNEEQVKVNSSEAADAGQAQAPVRPERIFATPESELDDLKKAVANTKNADSPDRNRELRNRLISFWIRHRGTPAAIVAADLMSQLVWPADILRRESVSAEELSYTGNSPAGGAPDELLAIYGSGRLHHWESVREIAFSPDSSMLATPGYDGAIGIWNAKTGEPITRLQSDPTRYEAVAFTSDGSEFVALGWGPYHHWDVDGWKFRKTVFQQHGALAGVWDTSCIIFSRDARQLLGRASDESILVCDPETGSLRTTLRGHVSPVKCVTISSDGQTAAAGDEQGRAIVWNLNTSEVRHQFEPGHGPIWSAALTHDGALLALGHADGSIALVGQQSQRMIKVAGSVGALCFSPSGERLLVGAGGTGNGVREIDIASGNIRHTLDPSSAWCHFPRYSPDGSTIACGYWDGAVGLWDAETGTRRSEPAGLRGAVITVAVSPDGAHLAGGGQPNYALTWRVDTGLARQLPLGFQPRSLAFAGNIDRLFAAATYGPNGARVAALWNMETGQREQSVLIPGSQYGLAAPVFAADGSFVLSADSKNSISIWEFAGRERLLLRNQAGVKVLAVSLDGTMIASAETDERIHVWDAISGDERRTIVTGAVEGTALAFSPDGSLLACGASDSKVHVWELATGDEVAMLSGHEPNRWAIQAISFNLKGSRLATCSADGTVRIWDPRLAEPLQTITVGPPYGVVRDVAFFPDGRHLATANQNGTVCLLRIDER